VGSKVYTIQLVGTRAVTIKAVDGTVYDTLTTSKKQITVSAAIYETIKTAVEGLEAAGYLAISDYSPSAQLKPACYVVSVSNITLANEQTVDSVAVKDGNRVLVQNQNDAKENGIYNCVSGAAWERALDFDSSADIRPGVLVPVSSGTSYADTLWMMSADDPYPGAVTLDTNNITFTQVNR
jgi:hypothetical protein